MPEVIDTVTPPTALLVVEDNLHARQWLRDWAERECPKFRLLFAAGLDEARRLARAHRPAVALVDIDMHDARGFEILRLLSSVAPDVHLIALSMFNAEAYRDYAAGAGAKACVSLATSDSKLKDTVGALLGSSRGDPPGRRT